MIADVALQAITRLLDGGPDESDDPVDAWREPSYAGHDASLSAGRDREDNVCFGSTVAGRDSV